MHTGLMRGLTACLLIAATTAGGGCAARYGHSSSSPSIRDEPVMDLGARCQLANRNVMVRSSMPELRRMCNPWADRQTAAVGY